MVLTSSSSDDESANRSRELLRQEFMRRRKRRLLKRRKVQKPSETDVEKNITSKHSCRTSSPINVPNASSKQGPNEASQNPGVPENRQFSLRIPSSFKFPSASLISTARVAARLACEQDPFVFNSTHPLLQSSNISGTPAPQNQSRQVPVVIGMTPDNDIFDPFTGLMMIRSDGSNQAEDSADTVSITSSMANDSFDRGVTSISQILQNESSVLANSGVVLTPLNQTTDLSSSIALTSHEQSIDPGSISATSLPHNQSVDLVPNSITQTSHSQSFDAEVIIIDPSSDSVASTPLNQSFNFELKLSDPLSNTVADAPDNQSFEPKFNSSVLAPHDQSIDLPSTSEAKLDASTQQTQSNDGVSNPVTQNLKPNPAPNRTNINIDFASIYVPPKHSQSFNLEVKRFDPASNLSAQSRQNQSFNPELIRLGILSNSHNKSFEPTFNSSALAPCDQSIVQASMPNESISQPSNSITPTSQNQASSSEAKLVASTQQSQSRDELSNPIASTSQNQSFEPSSNSSVLILNEIDFASIHVPLKLHSQRFEPEVKKKNDPSSELVAFTPQNQNGNPEIISFNALSNPDNQSFEPTLNSSAFASCDQSIEPASESIAQNQSTDQASNSIASSSQDQNLSSEAKLDAHTQEIQRCDGVSYAITNPQQDQIVERTSNSTALSDIDFSSIQVPLEEHNQSFDSEVNKNNGSSSDLDALTPQCQSFNSEEKKFDPASNFIELTPQSQSLISEGTNFDSVLNSSASRSSKENDDQELMVNVSKPLRKSSNPEVKTIDSVGHSSQNESFISIGNSVDLASSLAENTPLNFQVKLEESSHYVEKTSQSCQPILNSSALTSHEQSVDPASISVASNNQCLNPEVEPYVPSSHVVAPISHSQSFEPSSNSAQELHNQSSSSEPVPMVLPLPNQSDRVPNSDAGSPCNKSFDSAFDSVKQKQLSQSFNPEAKCFEPKYNYVPSLICPEKKIDTTPDLVAQEPRNKDLQLEPDFDQNFDPGCNSTALEEHDQSVDPVPNSAAEVRPKQMFDPITNLIALAQHFQTLEIATNAHHDNSESALEFNEFVQQNQRFNRASSPVAVSPRQQNCDPASILNDHSLYNQSLHLETDPVARTPLYERFHSISNNGDQSSRGQSFYTASDSVAYSSHSQNLHPTPNSVVPTPPYERYHSASDTVDKTSGHQSFHSAPNDAAHSSQSQSSHSLPNIVVHPPHDQDFDPMAPIHKLPPHIQRFFSQASSVSPPHSRKVNLASKRLVENAPQSSSFGRGPSHDGQPTHNMSKSVETPHNQSLGPISDVNAQMQLQSQIERFYSIPNIVAPLHNETFPTASNPVDHAPQNRSLGHAPGSNEQPLHNNPNFVPPNSPDLSTTSDDSAQMQLLPQIEKSHLTPNVVSPRHNVTFPPKSKPVEHATPNKSYGQPPDFNGQLQSSPNYVPPHSPSSGSTSDLSAQMQLLSQIERFYSKPNVVAPLHSENVNPTSNSVDQAQQNKSFGHAPGFNGQPLHDAPNFVAPHQGFGSPFDISAHMQHSQKLGAVPKVSQIQKSHSKPNVIAPPHNKKINPSPNSLGYGLKNIDASLYNKPAPYNEFNFITPSTQPKDLPSHFSSMPQHNQNREFQKFLLSLRMKQSAQSRIYGDRMMHNENINVAFDPAEPPAPDFSDHEPNIDIQMHDQTLRPESSLDTHSSSSQNFQPDSVTIQPQTQELDLTNMPNFVTRVGESENYEQISSFNPFAQHNQMNMSFNSTKIPHNDTLTPSSFRRSYDDTSYQNHIRNLNSMSNSVFNTARNQNVQPGPGFMGQPPQNVDFNPGPNFMTQPPPSLHFNPGPNFMGQPPLNQNINPGPHFTRQPLSNQNLHPGAGFMGQPPENHCFYPGPNFNGQPLLNSNVYPGPSFMGQPTENQNFNLPPNFHGHPFPNQNVNQERNFMEQPPPNQKFYPVPNLNVPPPLNQNFNMVPNFNEPPPQNQNFNLGPDFNGPVSQNQNFIGQQQNPALGYSGQPPHSRNTHTSPTFNNPPPHVQGIIMESDSNAPPTQNFNPASNPVQQEPQTQSFNNSFDDENYNNAATINEEPVQQEPLQEPVQESPQEPEQKSSQKPEPGTLEYYLSLPKDWFPSPRTVTLDPNPIIDEICKLDDINKHSYWILDLEYGFPRAPPTKHLAVYDARRNSIQRIDDIELPHPDYETCSREFKQVFMFYYDCVVMQWYRGYMFLTNDDSVVNFQKWLKVPLQKMGMCW